MPQSTIQWDDVLRRFALKKGLIGVEIDILLIKFPEQGVIETDITVRKHFKWMPESTLSRHKKIIYDKFEIPESLGRGQQDKLYRLLLDRFNKEESLPDNIYNVDLCSLWRQLLGIAEYTEEKMGLISPSQTQSKEFRKLRRKNNGGEKYLRQVKIDEDVLVSVCPESKGYLILFQRDVLGIIYCLAPSKYMPNNQIINNDEYIIPQDGTPISSDPCGKNELCAVMISDIARFDWLKNAKTNELIVKIEYLKQLLEYLEVNENKPEVFYTNFLVIE